MFIFKTEAFRVVVKLQPSENLFGWTQKVTADESYLSSIAQILVFNHHSLSVGSIRDLLLVILSWHHPQMIFKLPFKLQKQSNKLLERFLGHV
jgi:hypothetical protein